MLPAFPPPRLTIFEHDARTLAYIDMDYPAVAKPDAGKPCVLRLAESSDARAKVSGAIE